MTTRTLDLILLICTTSLVSLLTLASSGHARELLMDDPTASGVLEFQGDSLIQSRAAIRAYLDKGAIEGPISNLVYQTPHHFSLALAILDEAELHLSQRRNHRAERRIAHLLGVADRAIQMSIQQNGLAQEHLRTLLGEKIRPLLRRYSEWSVGRYHIVSIYQQMQLWDQDDLPFLMERLYHPNDSLRFQTEILHLTRDLSLRELFNLSMELEEQGHLHLGALLILYELDLLDPSLYPKLLGEAAKAFGRIHQDVTAREEFTRSTGLDWSASFAILSRALQSPLANIQQRYWMGDPLIKEAIHAVAMEPQAELLESAFFHLLTRQNVSEWLGLDENPSEQEGGSASIPTSSGQLSATGGIFARDGQQPHGQVVRQEDNIIHVHFAQNASCEGLLAPSTP